MSGYKVKFRDKVIEGVNGKYIVFPESKDGVLYSNKYEVVPRDEEWADLVLIERVKHDPVKDTTLDWVFSKIEAVDFYQNLLKKYIQHVGECEGITFLGKGDVSGESGTFTKEELEELKRLEKEV